MDPAQSWFSRLVAEIGISAITGSCRDTKLLCAQRMVRLFAYGASFLILVQFLSSLDIPDDRIGLFMTLTLLGDVAISFVLTAITDAVGRRKILAIGSFLMIVSGVVFFIADNYWILLFVSVLGVISPSGNEIGPFRAVEESVLAQLTRKEHRSDIFAWYTLLGNAGAALGTLTSGWLVQVLTRTKSWENIRAYRAVFLLYAVLGLVKLTLTLALSPEVEASRWASVKGGDDDQEAERGLLADGAAQQDGTQDMGTLTQPETPTKRGSAVGKQIRSLLPEISPESRSILWRLLLLFSVDSFASGMAAPSWLTYFFTKVHSLQPSTLGTLFLVTNILATVSNLAALPLARKIGPLKTMVFTHLPSSLCLAAIPLPPASAGGTWAAMGLLALRATTNSMDQAPRQAFLSAAVLPAERTAVLGVVNIVKTLAQAGGIGSTGILAKASLWIAVLGGAGLLKGLYDLMMLWMFLHLKDRDEEEVVST
ncbi:uncharacterized protein E0L32_002430 [Thyridium curvatum]|uniref:Major facilitator superfamily (MFS) profile domain-containing protein n=1 Tax=Thyridium curvatum TaxID=1093900 RepID=A0A507BGF5_9PEZI|nr:uncharacterized protein E0L32_002430 [Thyridium curvatum]TPX18573.1 hypothetical protein E0L32_002430 [Thyridium curvatum]